jgi:DNA-binding transcriptional ArsR family regulator
VFLSVDSRRIFHNPLYKSFKAKSFTDKDITLHFYLLDILADGEALTVSEVLEQITADYLSHFETEFSFDESTVRKKLKEYVDIGLLTAEKSGREVRYRRSADSIDLDAWQDAIAFFSEENPVGVIGSFLLDKFQNTNDHFGFKHHYILHAMDAEICCQLLMAMREHRAVELTVRNMRRGGLRRRTVYPMKLYVSAQGGRQYLLCYQYGAKHLGFFRLDAIHKVKAGTVERQHDRYMGYYEKFLEHLWGVSVGEGHSLDHIEMTVAVGTGEGHIPQRLEREKRHGTVERLDEHTYRFSADVYDASEMLPWLRTFIGRIVDLQCSNQSVVDTFYGDLAEMTRMYGGDGHAVQ